MIDNDQEYSDNSYVYDDDGMDQERHQHLLQKDVSKRSGMQDWKIRPLMKRVTKIALFILFGSTSTAQFWKNELCLLL